jgi:hypothetical protein
MTTKNAAQPEDAPPRRFSSAQKRLVGFILVLAVVNLTYRLIYASGFARTAALYIGLPTLLAIGLALLPRSKSAAGMIMKGSLLAVMIACVVLPEGLICLIFVLPLIGLIGVVVGGSIDVARRRGRDQSSALRMVGLPLLLLSMEGVVGTPFDTNDSVQATIVVEASPAEVRAALGATPRFDAEAPAFLRMGFNQPIAATGSGTNVGDRRMIEFTGGDHDDHPLRLFGLTGERSVDHHAHMQLTVTESSTNRLVFAIDDDTTMLSRWLELDRTVVTWEAVDATHTRVTWRLEYERLLFPTAYFAPLMRYGMADAAEYLLACVVAVPPA